MKMLFRVPDGPIALRVFKPSGESLSLLGAINMVYSKYAGLYKVIESNYFRIGVPGTPPNWNGSERFIGHVDDVTLSHNDAWGPFDDWAANHFISA
jgi:hypothetical protein